MEIAAGTDWFYCFHSHWLASYTPGSTILYPLDIRLGQPSSAGNRGREAPTLKPRTTDWSDIGQWSGSLEKAFINPRTSSDQSTVAKMVQDVQYMAEFDPEVCERNRQSCLHKGEVLRPQVLVAHTQRLKGSSRVTNAWRTIFYPPLFFASETICPTVRRQKGKKKSSSFSTVLQQDEWKN